jgi:hypothetical protein
MLGKGLHVDNQFRNHEGNPRASPHKRYWFVAICDMVPNLIKIERKKLRKRLRMASKVFKRQAMYSIQNNTIKSASKTHEYISLAQY